MNEAEFLRLATRGTDYDELLRRGSIVIDEPEDVRAWRMEMRRLARLDKISITTRHDRERATVSAWMNRRGMAPFDPFMFQVMFEAFDRAALRGHGMTRFIRNERMVAAARCQSCGARLLVNWTRMPAEPPFMEGHVPSSGVRG